MSVLGFLRRRVAASFLNDEKGALTVEAVLWLPIWLGFFAFIADVSIVLHKQANAMRIVQDAHRIASLGWLETTNDVEATIVASLKRIAPSVSAESEINDGVLRTVVTMRSSELVAIGLITAISDVDMSFATVHMIET